MSGIWRKHSLRDGYVVSSKGRFFTNRWTKREKRFYSSADGLRLSQISHLQKDALYMMLLSHTQRMARLRAFPRF